MKSLSVGMLVLFFLTACASSTLQHEGRVYDSTSPAKIRASTEVLKDYTDKHNVFLQVNFENLENSWMRLELVDFELDFHDENIPYNIVVGDDLKAWAESSEEKLKIRRQNTDGILLGIFAASTAVTLFSQNQNQMRVGLGGMVASSAFQNGVLFSRAYKDAEGGLKVPETHLLAPFTVPSMGLVKRWILINFPDEMLMRNNTASIRGKRRELFVVLKFKTVEGDTLNYRVQIARKLSGKQ